MGAEADAVLTAAQRATLSKVLEEILPSDSGAGAREADAAEYVVRRLRGPDSRWLPELRAALDDAAADEAGYVARLAAANDSAMFARLRTWAWEGYLCDPAYGGNRDRVGWRRFGFPGDPKERGYRPSER